jgi:hypothetical protein
MPKSMADKYLEMEHARDCYRALLEGMEFENLDDLNNETPESARHKGIRMMNVIKRIQYKNEEYLDKIVALEKELDEMHELIDYYRTIANKLSGGVF